MLACVTDEGFVARIRRAGGPYPAAFQAGFAILDCAPRRGTVRLSVVHSYRVVPAGASGSRWEAKTSGWVYDLADSRDQPIVAFHWHPENSGRVTRPHIHVSGVHETVELRKLHFPTGQVSLAAVLRFAIEDLNVVPRRSDWQALLDDGEGRP